MSNSENENTVYIRGIPFSATAEDIMDFISQFVEVEFYTPEGRNSAVVIPMDRETGRARGFAFVSLKNPEDVQSVCDAVDGQQWNEREIGVKPALPKEQRPAGGGNRFQSNGGGNGGGDNYRRNRY